jgi:uncharacterized protein (TIGR02145 family)
MKSIGTTLWQTPNADATNNSGFTGFPGGIHNANGNFGGNGQYGIWWSSSESITTTWTRYLNYISGDTGSYSYNKTSGFSVRCLRD